MRVHVYAVFVFFSITLASSAQDILTVGGSQCIAGTPGSVVQIPIAIHDASGTSLGVDQPSGSRIQAFSFNITPDDPGAIATDSDGHLLVRVAPAGIASALGPPIFTATPRTATSFGHVAVYDETAQPLAFTPDGPPPGNVVGAIFVKLRATAVPGSTIALAVNSGAAVTVLSNEAGTGTECAGSSLVITSGCISVGNAAGNTADDAPTLNVWMLLALAALLAAAALYALKNSAKLALYAIVFLAGAATIRGDVVPPLDTRIEIVRPPERLSAQAHSSLTFTVRTHVPEYDANPEASLQMTVRGTGIVRIASPGTWSIQPVLPGKEYSDTISAEIAGYGEGSIEVHVDSFDAAGAKLWGRTDTLFVLSTPEDFLYGKSSVFELRRSKLARARALGVLSEERYRRELDNLLLGRDRTSEPQTRDGSSVVAAVVPTTDVTGRVTYTQRINRVAGADTFAAAAAALPVRGALIEFYDRNGAVLTQIGPKDVRTDDNGAYAAAVPGMRANLTAVNLVVRVLADNDGARTGLAGQRKDVHMHEAPAMMVTSVNTTVDILIDNTSLLSLRAFSVQEGMLTAYRFIVANNAATGVGAAPAKIFVEFPGPNANKAEFDNSPDHHIVIGQNHAFDWDVYTHEYGHYVQEINKTSQSPGGCHLISNNLTGFNQATCGGTNHTPLTKEQAIALAWAEGWATFFGTNLQISTDAGAMGIYTLGDTRYTDTANNFSYDLEGNTDTYQGKGEDNELSVQRTLWDFADGPQDGHDELAYGNEEMWRQLAGVPAVVTLDGMRSKFAALLPPSPKGYSVGDANLVAVRQGRIYADFNVGSNPLDPLDNERLSEAPSDFAWEAKGAGGPPGYRFNKFKVLFYTEDFATLKFTSPEIATAANDVLGLWTPTAAEWAMIRAPNPATGSPVTHWLVRGSNDTLAPATGPYPGLDRTLGSVDVTYVIDDTGSMSEEIAGVRAALTKNIADLRALGKSPVIELVTFKDDVTRRITTKDTALVEKEVANLRASGGGDCPESSVEALLEVSKEVVPRGVIILATDASPHAGMSLAGIKAALAARGITLTVILTGECASGDELRGGPRPLSVANPNRDPSYTPAAKLPAVPDMYGSVECGDDCRGGTTVGPALSENALKPIGDPSLAEPDAVAAFQEIAAASPAGTFLYYPSVNGGDSLPFQNAVANAALSATVPVVIAVEPVDLVQGATMDILIRGGATNFQKTSEVSFSGGGITVNSTSFLSPRTLRANVTVSSLATTGFRNVTVITPLAPCVTATTTAGSGQARVVANTGAPAVTSVVLGTITRGTTGDLTISVVNLPLNGATTVTIASLVVNSVTVLGPASIRASVTAPPNASLGFKAVDIVTGTAHARTQVMVSVIAGASGAAIPKFSMTPSTILRGHVTTITVEGTDTSFVNSVTAASVSGTGVDVLSTVVASPASATVQVSVARGAELGFRDVIMTTAGEVAAVTTGLLVADAIPGDVNGDGQITVTDAMYLADSVSGGGPAPVASGDVDGDGDVDAQDVQYLVNYLFAGGPPP